MGGLGFWVQFDSICTPGTSHGAGFALSLSNKATTEHRRPKTGKKKEEEKGKGWKGKEKKCLKISSVGSARQPGSSLGSAPLFVPERKDTTPTNVHKLPCTAVYEAGDTVSPSSLPW